MIERLVLPKPEITFSPSASLPHDMRFDSFSPLGRDCILFTESSRRTSLYNADLRFLRSIPPKNSCKHSFDISLPMIQTNHVDQIEDRSLYVMDLSPHAKVSSCFEILSYRDGWCWHTLPGPPFLSFDPSFPRNIDKFCHTLVDSSTICISSMEHGIGTYTFDTVSHVWRHVGNWVLPFYGKAEYVPELKICLGLSNYNTAPMLCAFDLSVMDAQQPPMAQPAWDYLDLSGDTKTLVSDLHLVNLGSGMFCIATLLRTMFYPDSPYTSDEDIIDIIDEEFIVLTGVKVERCCNDIEAPVKMIKHKSKRYVLKGLSLKSVL